MDDLNKLIDEVLATLSLREQQVLRMRFGLDDGHPKSLKEVAQILPRADGEGGVGVTPARVREIEGKGLRKMRHPSRSRRLKEHSTVKPQQEMTPADRLLRAIFGS